MIKEEGLKRYKDQEQDLNDRRIEDEIEAIFNDPMKGAFASTIADALGLHRNTVNNRIWELSRPMSLGESRFAAGDQVTVKDLLIVIKEYRGKKKDRRSKGKIRQAEVLSDEIGGLEELLANMQDENAQLFHEIEDLQSVIKIKQRSLEVESNLYSKELSKTAKLAKRIQELEAELGYLKAQSGKKASLTVLNPQTDKE